ncbi:cytosine permease [Schumannella soli]|uniref:Permease n=1 Tax=Schumannella soli TaxID=2590779 RepID=A0A506Y6V0_9MICO|nr:cytosine permease [Schumannella soli]TPW76139.1 hypothetical protein FJ657_10020 [Schumannella soli]
MTGEPDSARADDDALADAILASFTAAIPVIVPADDGAGVGVGTETAAPGAVDPVDTPVTPAPVDTPLAGPLAPSAPPLDSALSGASGPRREPSPRDDVPAGPTVIPAAHTADAEPWAVAPAPAAAFTWTAQLPLPPAELLDPSRAVPGESADQTLAAPRDAAADVVAAPATVVGPDPASTVAGDGLLGGFAAGDDDLATTLASRLRELAPPDPSAAVPPAAAPAPPSSAAGGVAAEGLADDHAHDADGEIDRPATPVPATSPDRDAVARSAGVIPDPLDSEGAPPLAADLPSAEPDQSWSAAPPPAFSPPALVEPPSWAAGFASSVSPDSAAPERAPHTAVPEHASVADPESAPPGPIPVQDTVDLSAFAAPLGPPSGLITLPPEAWLAERSAHADGADRAAEVGAASATSKVPSVPSAPSTAFDRMVAAFDESYDGPPAPVSASVMALAPDLAVSSLIDPRLSAAATSDSAYSDDDDGSVDPDDRVAGSTVPAGSVAPPPWPTEPNPDELRRAASDAGLDTAFDGADDDPGTRPDPDLDSVSGAPAAAAETTTAVTAPPRLPRILGVEFGAVEPTPAELRAGRAPRLFWLAFAPTASLLLLGVGAGLIAAGASLRQAVVAVVIGAALSALPIALSVLAARWSGQSALVTSRAVFGVVGNALPAVLAAVTRIGWAGALLWLTADAVGGVAAAAGSGDAGSVRVVALVVGILLTGLIAALGYGLLGLVQAIATVVGVAGATAVIALTVTRVDLTRALSLPDGSWSLVVGGAGLVVAVGGLALVQSIGDVARYQRTGGAAASHGVAAVLGAALPVLALTGWGSLLAASDPELARRLAAAPITALVELLPSAAAAPLLAAVAVSGVAGAAIAIYSAGLAVTAAGVRAPRPLATVPPALIAALVAVLLLAARIDASALLHDAAQLLAVPVAAWAGIVGGDLLLRTRRLHTPSLLRRRGVYPDARPAPLVTLLGLTVLGWLLLHPALPGLAVVGGLLAPFGDAGVAAQPGVLVALVGGLLAGLASGLGAVRRQERAVVEATPSDS